MDNTQKIYKISLAYMDLNEGKKITDDQIKLLSLATEYELVMAVQIAAAAILSENSPESLNTYLRNIELINSIRKEERLKRRVENTIDAIDKEDLSKEK